MVLFSITADFCHVVVPPSLQSYSQDAHASRGMSANSTQKSFMPFLMNKKITDSFFFFLPFFHGPALHFAPFSYPPPFLSFQIFISLSRPLATFFFFLIYVFFFYTVLFSCLFCSSNLCFSGGKLIALSIIVHGVAGILPLCMLIYFSDFVLFSSTISSLFDQMSYDQHLFSFVVFFPWLFLKLDYFFIYIYIYLYFLYLSTWYRMNY